MKYEKEWEELRAKVQTAMDGIKAFVSKEGWVSMPERGEE